MKKIKKKLDPRMEQKKDAKYDPWVNSGGQGYASSEWNRTSDDPPSLAPPSNQYATNYWSSTNAREEGKAEAIRRLSDANVPYPSSPRGNETSLSEEQQLRLALELSEKEERERQRRRQEEEQHDADLKYALEASRRETKRSPQTQQPAGTNPFGSASVDDPLGLYSDSSAQQSSLYEREAAYAQHIGEDGHRAIIARQQDFSELENVFKTDSQKQSMKGYGFADCCKLYGKGDCAVLVCLVCRLLLTRELTYDAIEPRFGDQAVDVSAERRSLLQWLYDHAFSIPEIRTTLLMEAEINFPHIKNPVELVQQHITKMSRDQAYLGVAEMMAGPYRDGYVLAFIRERPHTAGGGLEVAQLIAPPSARAVFYALFSDAGHFDILRPLPINMSDPSLFAGAPWSIRNDLERLYKRHMGLEVDEGERALSPDGSGKSSTTNPWDAPSRKSSASSAKNPWDEPRRPSAGTGTGAAPGAGNPWNEAQGRRKSSATRDAWDKNGDLFGGESLLSGKPSAPAKTPLAYGQGVSGSSSSGAVLVPQQPLVDTAAAERERKVAELQAKLKQMSMGPSVPPGNYAQPQYQGAGYGMPPMAQPGYGMGAPAPGFGYAGPMMNQGMMPGPPMGMAYGAPQQPMAGYPMQMPMQPQMQQPVNYVPGTRRPSAGNTAPRNPFA